MARRSPLDRPLSLSGDGPLELSRDEHGVVHVRAEWDTDLIRGLGYAHAVDRGLQMWVTRALARGRACEWLADSDELLEVDTFFRKSGLARGLSEEIDKLPAEHKRLMTAYVDGVNRAVEAHGLPWELKPLPYKHEPWTREDTVLLTRVIAYVNLAQSQGEMEHLIVELVQGGVPRELVESLFPEAAGELDPWLLKKVRLGDKVVPDAVRWLGLAPAAMASNNWVISGERTASGQPMLANDPHLEVNRLPGVWYEAVLELEDRWCVCSTMPGLPGPLIGRTNDLAWGVTYAFMDATDSWVEECREGCYRRAEGGRTTWLPFSVREEVIRRAKHDDVTLRVYENAHGVLDGDPHDPGHYLTTRWASAENTGGASLAALLSVLHAKDVQQGMALLSHVETAWSWVLCDTAGHIGYQMSGRMPLRNEGRVGLCPLPGWDPSNDWRGFVPSDRLPWALDPAEGFLVSANNDLNHLGRSRPINLPMGPYRADRIAEVLASRDDWTVDETRRLQLDLHSPQAERFMALIRPLLPDTPGGQELRDWDLRYDAASRGAARFEALYRALLRGVFGAHVGDEVMTWLLDECAVVADFYWNFDRVLLDAESPWYGGRARAAVWQPIVDAICAEPSRKWGEQREFVMRHLLFGGKLPRLAGFDHGPLVLEGGRATVCQGQLYRSGGRETSFAPSYRMVTDLAEPEAHTALASGVSDRRFSRLYRQGIDAWLAGKLKRLAPSPKTHPA